VSGIAQALSAFIAGQTPLTLLWADVTEVDAGSWTFDCQPIDGSAPLLDVAVGVSKAAPISIAQLPATGSRVLVGLVGKSGAAVLVAAGKVTDIALEVEGGSKIVINATGIEVGSQGLQPAVKGDDLEARLGDVCSLLTSICNAFLVFAPAMAGAAAPPPLTPLAAPASALGAALAPLLAQISALQAQLPLFKSQIVKVE
jgi:hypothetical protein